MLDVNFLVLPPQKKLFLQMLPNTFDPIPNFDVLEFCIKTSEINHNNLPKIKLKNNLKEWG